MEDQDDEEKRIRSYAEEIGKVIQAGASMEPMQAIITLEAAVQLSRLNATLKKLVEVFDLPEEWKKNAGPKIDASRRNVQSQP
jgi:hypothetical protein